MVRVWDPAHETTAEQGYSCTTCVSPVFTFPGVSGGKNNLRTALYQTLPLCEGVALQDYGAQNDRQ